MVTSPTKSIKLCFFHLKASTFIIKNLKNLWKSYRTTKGSAWYMAYRKSGHFCNQMRSCKKYLSFEKVIATQMITCDFTEWVFLNFNSSFWMFESSKTCVNSQTLSVWRDFLKRPAQRLWVEFSDEKTSRLAKEKLNWLRYILQSPSKATQG